MWRLSKSDERLPTGLTPPAPTDILLLCLTEDAYLIAGNGSIHLEPFPRAIFVRMSSHVHLHSLSGRDSKALDDVAANRGSEKVEGAHVSTAEIDDESYSDINPGELTFEEGKLLILKWAASENLFFFTTRHSRRNWSPFRYL